MRNQICSGVCKQPLPHTIKYFNRNKAKKHGLNTICRECSNKHARQYYASNRVHHLANVMKNKHKYVQRNQQFILRYLSWMCCKDCQTTDIRVLEFDHIRGQKKRNVSNLISQGWSLSSIKQEIRKCDVVCANCHRIRTRQGNKDYRFIAQG